MNLTYKKVMDLIPYENNPRNNEKAVEIVSNSIKEFGFKIPIIIDKNNTIVCGHTRYKSAIKLGINQVPCIIADDLTEEQIKAFRLVDNKTSEYAEWDFDLLDNELMELSKCNFNMGDFDFSLIEEEIEPKEDYFDIDKAISNEPKSKIGQIYKLGNHRLMVGDSTCITDVNKLTKNEEMDLVVTDPPYNVAIENSKGMTIENDNMGNEAFFNFLTSAFYNINNSLKPGGSFYIWFASREHINFEKALNENNLKVRQELIWNKNSLVLSRQDYQWKHEPCLYGWKDGEAHYFIDDRTQTTVIEDQEKDFNKMKKIELVNLLESIYSLKLSTTIIDEKRPSINDLHPTMKPIKLIAKLIKNSSRPGEKVLDLFGGSGSTLIACEQLNRICYMMEYDPKYADVIINRWETYTGKKAELIK